MLSYGALATLFDVEGASQPFSGSIPATHRSLGTKG